MLQDEIIYSGLLSQSTEFKQLPKDWNILPKGYNLYYYKKGMQYAVYINHNIVPLENLKKTIGNITFTIDYEELDITIQYIKSNLPKVGIAHYLMLIVGYIAKYNNIKPISIIYLDDDSDNAHKPNNIYLKLGCEYKNPNSNEPEMECNPNIILSKFDIFYDKYVITSTKSNGSIFFKQSM
jgi:hypothetical protein